MNVSRLLSRRGFSPAAIVLLLTVAIVGGGIEIRPAPAGDCSIANDDHLPDPQPREEPAEDDDNESGKHATLSATIALDWVAASGVTLVDRHARRAACPQRGAAPIRGPPAPA